MIAFGAKDFSPYECKPIVVREGEQVVSINLHTDCQLMGIQVSRGRANDITCHSLNVIDKDDLSMDTLQRCVESSEVYFAALSM